MARLVVGRDNVSRFAEGRHPDFKPAADQGQAVERAVTARVGQVDPAFVADEAAAERHQVRGEPAVALLPNVQQTEVVRGREFALHLGVVDVRARSGRSRPLVGALTSARRAIT